MAMHMSVVIIREIKLIIAAENAPFNGALTEDGRNDIERRNIEREQEGER